VSIDPAGALKPRIEKLISDAQEFRSFLQVGGLHPHIPWNAEWEMGGARRMRELVASLKSLEASELPIQARHGLNELRRLLSVLIERWKWDRVVGSEGEAFLAEKKRLRDDKERSYLAAIRSYVEAFCERKISQRPGEYYFDKARTAEVEGIPPNAPAVLSEEELDTLGKAWIHSPYLAPDFPTLMPGEYEAIDSAIRDLRDGSREHVTLQPALVEECRRAEAELAEARARDPLPDPDRLTVGETMAALRVMEGAYALIGTSKIFFEQYHRRRELLDESPGFKVFRRWASSVLGTHPTSEAAEAFLSRLARRIEGTFDEGRGMRLMDAVELLHPSPSAGPPPEGTEAPGPAAPAGDLDPRPDAPRTEAPPSNRKIPRGSLDERATIELKKNPSLTYAQLASILECRPGTLRDRRKCPLLAIARALIKAERDVYRGAPTWRDRRPDGDEA
jgi:hypothetical protein